MLAMQPTARRPPSFKPLDSLALVCFDSVWALLASNGGWTKIHWARGKGEGGAEIGGGKLFLFIGCTRRQAVASSFRQILSLRCCLIEYEKDGRRQARGKIMRHVLHC